VLGPLAAVRDGHDVPLGSRKQRTVLALLLVAGGRTVNDDVLVDVLWGETPPPSVQNNLQALVSRLRRGLGAEAIERRGEGYAVRLDDVALDSREFADLAQRGHSLLHSGDAAAAEDALRKALALFRGEPYADFRYDDFAAGEIGRLDELRLAAEEDRVEALLALGRHREAVSELDTLVARYPYHERFRHQQVLALYREGRQADALAAHREARQTLVDDLGVDPSAEFRALEGRILRQEDELLASTSTRDARGGRRTTILGAGAVITAIATAAVALALRSSSGEAASIHANSLVLLDREGDPIASLDLPFEPRGVVGSAGSVWVAAARTNAVVRIDVRARRIVQTVGLSGLAPAGLAADEHGAWVATETGRSTFALERLVPGRDGPVTTILWRTIANFSVGERTAPLTEGGGALWASNGESEIVKFDPTTGDELAHLSPDEGAGPVTWGGGSLWTTYTLSDSVTRVDPRRATVAATVSLAQSTLPLPRVGSARRGDVDPSALVYAFGSLWVAGYGIDSVIRIDPVAGRVLATIPVGDGPNALAAADDAIWVADRLGRSIVRIEPELNRVTATRDLGFRAESVTVVDGRAAVAVQGR